MRKGLRSAGAVARGTTRLNQIEVNSDPPKLLDQISTNHKVTELKTSPGNSEPAQPGPERREPGE
ncbi:hypothetical protein H4Q26_009937 [Puccinia striiformis f. sp. tritici PST-130]|nr:hypothetical protein H4Q26_009937 [Puccinia striiformis f. sp. tritici PST-130]